MSSKKGKKRSIIEIEHPSREQTLGRTPIQGQTLGRRSGRCASTADTRPRASKRQDRSSSSGSREVPTDSMGTAAAVGTDPTASGTVTDTATLGSVIDPASATTGTDPATSATGTDPMALARVTDTPLHHRQPAESSQIGPLPDTQLRRERDLTATTNLGTAIQSEIGSGHSRRRQERKRYLYGPQWSAGELDCELVHELPLPLVNLRAHQCIALLNRPGNS